MWVYDWQRLGRQYFEYSLSYSSKGLSPVRLEEGDTGCGVTAEGSQGGKFREYSFSPHRPRNNPPLSLSKDNLQVFVSGEK